MRAKHGGPRRKAEAIDFLRLEETKGWVHHVANLDRDREPATTRLRRPVAPLSRARRWRAAGLRFDPDILAFPPARRLTPKRNYQESPRSSLVAHHSAAFAPEADEVIFGPYGYGPTLQHGAGLSFHFHDVRPSLSLATIRLSAYAAPGTTGFVTLTGWYTSRRFAITGYADHVLDLFTTPPTAEIIVLGLEIGEGIVNLTFRELTYRTIPVLSPTA
jgi:hypothetical protein